MRSLFAVNVHTYMMNEINNDMVALWILAGTVSALF